MKLKRRLLKALIPLIVALLVLAIIALRYATRRSDATKVVAVLRERPLKSLGIIMDGNRRWARKQGFKPWIGHKEGVAPLKTTVKFCLEHDIPSLTLFVFSLENFKRSAEELHFLFDVLAQEVAGKEFQELHENGVKIRFIGDRIQFPAQLIPLIEDIELKTLHNTKLSLNLLFCYGGQQEVVAATQEIARKVARRELRADAVTAADFEAALWTAGIPPFDLIIRTGYEKRISGFGLYKSAYSELYFMDCYWPEVTEQHLIDAVLSYARRERRHGS